MDSWIHNIVWDLGDCVGFGGCAGFRDVPVLFLEISWNRELKVTYLRAPVELDNKF